MHYLNFQIDCHRRAERLFESRRRLRSANRLRRALTRAGITEELIPCVILCADADTFRPLPEDTDHYRLGDAVLAVGDGHFNILGSDEHMPVSKRRGIDGVRLLRAMAEAAERVAADSAAAAAKEARYAVFTAAVGTAWKEVWIGEVTDGGRAQMRLSATVNAEQLRAIVAAAVACGVVAG